MKVDSIFISAGHSDNDPGAVANGQFEAAIACEFRNMVAFYLHRMGVAYEMDGDRNQNLPLRDAVKKAKQHTLAVEFHCNAGPSTATGVEVLSAPREEALAVRLSKTIAETLGIRNRGAKPENSGQHHRLAFISDGEGLIVELFFITNKNDLAAYHSRKWLAARAVAEVLVGSL